MSKEICVCHDIAAQKKLEQLGVIAREVVSLDEMRSASPAEKAEQCPSQALHAIGCEGVAAYDDITGHELDPKLMTHARKEEIICFRDMACMKI